MKSIFLWILFAFTVVPVSLNAKSANFLFDKEVQVLRDDFKEVHFLIPEDTKSRQVKGSFKSKGGFNDDLTFYIFTKDHYARWYSHRSNEPVAKFEKKMEGNFQFDAKPGETYYFVLDNFFSTVSNKTVKLQIQLLP
jgi:hypothetical protein